MSEQLLLNLDGVVDAGKTFAHLKSSSRLQEIATLAELLLLEFLLCNTSAINDGIQTLSIPHYC
jgi:hypothetical protein